MEARAPGSSARPPGRSPRRARAGPSAAATRPRRRACRRAARACTRAAPRAAGARARRARRRTRRSPRRPWRRTISRSTSSPSAWRKRSTRTENWLPSKTVSPPSGSIGGSSVIVIPASVAPAASAAAKNSGSARPIERVGSPLAAVPVEVGRRRAPVVTLVGRLLAVGQRDDDRRQQQLEHRPRVVADAAVTLAPVGARHARDEQRLAAERERGVRRVERLQAAVPERRAGAEDPGPRSGHRRVPAELGEPVVQRRGGRDRLPVGAAEGGPGGQVAGEQPALAQRSHDARVPAGQRAAGRLDVARAARRRPARTPTPAARADRAGRARPRRLERQRRRGRASPPGRPPRRAARRAAGSCS